MIRLPRKLVVASIAVLGLAGPSAQADRQPVPTAQQIQAADVIISETYKERFARAGQTDRIALAADLFAQARRSSRDADAQYALLCRARDLAAGAGELSLAMKACDELAADFAVTPASQQSAMFAQALPAMFTEDDYATYTAAALQCADMALKTDDFDSARALLKLAHTAAPKARNVRLVNMTRRHEEAADAQQRAFAVVQPQLAALTAKPDDGKLKSAVGDYICFWDGDWDRGLPLLAGGADPKWAALARQDLLGPLEPEAQAAVGDAWFRSASQATGLEKLHIEVRAYDWLQRALPHLSGLRAEHAQMQLKTLDPLISQYYDWGEIWIAVRAALRQRTAVETDVAAGAFGKISYQEIPQAGAILVGFRFGLGKFVSNDTVTQVQAIYQTPQGTILGESRGSNVGGIVEVRARNGYAVGALIVRGGGGLDAVTVVFMKIVGNKLDPTQSYPCSRVGGSGGSDTIIDGGGIPIIGVTGKIDSNEHAAGLGVVFLCAPPEIEEDPNSHHRRPREAKLTPVP